ncbi:nuclear transport factor 2 family protein [Segetibacter aerophilus]|uniref:SnoaL-like domain-containing protein n=1 Tax=Segetibacter aerophilus TaxID=670293 RepID=A0A512BGG9_9BACT|nr:nuclear transport factor 2 family protein [Segetibacter aerophilus]GEO11062.1 hypothetical protein SAE01_35580 [Segetibacter aerophilus]
MQPSNKEIGERFSKGNFSFCYDYFAENIEWKIIGNTTVRGKEDVIAYCDKMSAEIGSDTLINSNTIFENNQIAIEGNCRFVGPDGKPSEIAYCDVYRFDNSKIASITSYCIETKEA